MKLFLGLFLSLTIGLIACNSNPSQKKTITVKEADIIKNTIGVKGMTCVGCEITLEDNVSNIEGVLTVMASHSKNEATIEFDSTKTNINVIISTIKSLGYNPYKK